MSVQIVTEFIVKQDMEAPAVTAKRAGTTWQFNWPGRMSGAGTGTLVNCDYDTAVKIAAEIAERIAEIEPYRQEVMRRQEDVVLWVDEQREPSD